MLKKLFQYIDKIQGLKTDLDGTKFKVMDDMTLIQKAQYSKELLDNPMFMNIYNSIREQLIMNWENSQVIDIKNREVTYMRLEALKKIMQMIQGYIAEAIYEQKMKEEKEK